LTYIKGAIEQDFSREAADCQATAGMACAHSEAGTIFSMPVYDGCMRGKGWKETGGEFTL